MSLSKAIFTSEMNRLKETFGKEKYPNPRVQEIWKVVNQLPDTEFIRIISRMVGEIQIHKPPTVIEFREFAETKLKELRERSGPQGWEQVADEIAARKELLLKLTPEEREERKKRIKEMAAKITKVMP